MVLGLSVKDNIRQFERTLSRVQRKQVPFATSVALNKTAKHVQQVDKRVMARVFDQPRPFTLNSTRIVFSNKQTLRAEVVFREFAGKGVAAGKYLLSQVHGGPRRPKRSELLLRSAGLMQSDEFLVPADGFPLDAFSNVPPGLMNRILSQIKAQRDPTANKSARSGRRRRRRSQGGQFFVARRGGALPPGIYERFGARAIRAALLFVSQPRYAVRFPMFEINRRVATKRFPREFQLAFAQALRSAR